MMIIEGKRIELIQKINSIESEELMVIVDDMVNEVFAKEKRSDLIKNSLKEYQALNYEKSC